MTSVALGRNIGYLTVLQVANYAAPLIVVPYLTRTVGVSGYGHVAFALAFVQAAIVVTDFGLSMLMPADLALRASDRAQQHSTVSAALILKAILVVAAGTVSIALALARVGGDRGVLFASISATVGLSFQSLWFFQARERLGWVTAYSVVSRALYVLMIILVVHPGTVPAIPVLASGLSSLVGAVISFVGMHILGFRFEIKAVARSKELAWRAKEFFLSRVAISTYTAGGAIALGAFASAPETGRLAVAQQIYLVVQTAVGAVVQAVYPYMLRTKNFALLFRLAFAAFVITVCFSLAMLLYGREVLRLVYGSPAASAFAPLACYMIALPFSAVSALLGYPLFGAIGRLDIANRTVVAAGILQILWLASWLATGEISATIVVVGVLMIEAVLLGTRLFLWKGAKAQAVRL